MPDAGQQTDFAALMATIKRALRARGITYRDVARRLDMSESGIKKMLTGDDCSYGRLAAIAEVLGVSLSDLLAQSREEAIRSVELSESQQRYFVAHLDCFACYWKLAIERMSPHEIGRRYRVPKRRLTQYLSALDDLGLLTLEPGGRVRVHDTDLIRWIDTGPLMDLLNQRWSEELLAECLRRSDRQDYLFRLHYLALRADSATEMRAALASLIDEFRRRASREQLTTRRDALVPVSLMLAAAPRSFVEEIKR